MRIRFWKSQLGWNGMEAEALLNAIGMERALWRSSARYHAWLSRTKSFSSSFVYSEIFRIYSCMYSHLLLKITRMVVSLGVFLLSGMERSGMHARPLMDLVA